MNLKLSKKTAFISGSTQGIGYAIARQFLKEGTKVIINGRRQEKIDDAIITLKQEIPDANVTGIAADFTNPDEIDHLLSSLPQIDILVNNVGSFEQKAFDKIPDEEWKNMFELNVLSGVRLARHILPGMLERDWGRIIFISSESAVNVPGDMIHYGMTKSGMGAVSNGLSKLTKDSKVTVNTIMGGPTYSEGVAAVIEQLAEKQQISVQEMKEGISQQTNPQSLLQRFIEPSEIATLAAYVASPLSSAINGACLRADGGTLQTI